NPDLQLLAQLLALLQDRPHYQQAHIFGHWRSAYGASATERLGKIAGHDLIEATADITKPQADRPAKAEFDEQQTFLDAVTRIRERLKDEATQHAVHALKNIDPRSMPKDELRKLIENAMKRP